MGWGHLHGSRRSQSSGACVVRAHQCSCPSHHARSPGGSSRSGEVAPFAACAVGGKPSLTGVRSVLWGRDLAGGGRMKKGAYKQLNLTHLEATLSQVLEAAQREQWTYETFLERALAAELEGREQKAIARRLKAARIPSKKTVDGFDFAFQ